MVAAAKEEAQEEEATAAAVTEEGVKGVEVMVVADLEGVETEVEVKEAKAVEETGELGVVAMAVKVAQVTGEVDLGMAGKEMGVKAVEVTEVQGLEAEERVAMGTVAVGMATEVAEMVAAGMVAEVKGLEAAETVAVGTGMAAADWAAVETGMAAADWAAVETETAAEDWAAAETETAAEDWAAAETEAVGTGMAAEDWAAVETETAAEDWAAVTDSGAEATGMYTSFARQSSSGSLSMGRPSCFVESVTVQLLLNKQAAEMADVMSTQAHVGAQLPHAPFASPQIAF